MPWKDPEKEKQYQKEYREKNKERLLQRKKEYYQKTQEKQKEFSRNYRKTDNGKKSKRISDWKSVGLIHENYDELYKHYLETTNCNVCNADLSKTKKCMDHDHDTGLFRYILCNACNSHDSFKTKV